MRHHHVVRAVLCLILTLGCAKFENENAKSESAKTEANSIEAKYLSDFIKLNVQPTVKPERYIVYFSWPQIIDEKRIRIRTDQELIVVSSTQSTFSHEVDHNQTVTYSFDILDSKGKIEKSFARQVVVPRDYVVREGSDNLVEPTSLIVNRLFFDKTKIKTNGFNLEITANEMISNDGVIETFAENTKAKENVAGRSGGNIIIRSKVAVGQLLVILRGEDGGDGSKGISYSARAKDGIAAGYGEAECECSPRACPHVSPIEFLESLNINKEIQRLCFCVSHGTNASNGADGLKGRKGSPAMPGGDSGTLKVIISDGAGFEIKTIREMGLAGKPGAGGEGQPGGFGGEGGPSGRNRDCRGEAGGNGAPGPVGDIGDPAADGKFGQICIYVASESRSDCY